MFSYVLLYSALSEKRVLENLREEILSGNGFGTNRCFQDTPILLVIYITSWYDIWRDTLNVVLTVKKVYGN
jgi:hypothetical protein